MPKIAERLASDEYVLIARVLFLNEYERVWITKQ